LQGKPDHGIKDTLKLMRLFMYDRLIKYKAGGKAPWGYVSEVDVLRALAMTAVFAKHCNLMPFGWAGVWLFFVISGFAITSSLLGSARFGESKALLLRNFYILRCLRIWPIYFLIITGSMIAAALARNREAFGHWPWLATFTYNYLPVMHRDLWGLSPTCGRSVSKSNSISSFRSYSPFCRRRSLLRRFGFLSLFQQAHCSLSCAPSSQLVLPRQGSC
jgi:hypothetical protein